MTQNFDIYDFEQEIPKDLSDEEKKIFLVGYFAKEISVMDILLVGFFHATLKIDLWPAIFLVGDSYFSAKIEKFGIVARELFTITPEKSVGRIESGLREINNVRNDFFHGWYGVTGPNIPEGIFRPGKHSIDVVGKFKVYSTEDIIKVIKNIQALEEVVGFLSHEAQGHGFRIEHIGVGQLKAQKLRVELVGRILYQLQNLREIKATEPNNTNGPKE